MSQATVTQTMETTVKLSYRRCAFEIKAFQSNATVLELKQAMQAYCQNHYKDCTLPTDLDQQLPPLHLCSLNHIRLSYFKKVMYDDSHSLVQYVRDRGEYNFDIQLLPESYLELKVKITGMDTITTIYAEVMKLYDEIMECDAAIQAIPTTITRIERKMRYEASNEANGNPKLVMKELEVQRSKESLIANVGSPEAMISINDVFNDKVDYTIFNSNNPQLKETTPSPSSSTIFSLGPCMTKVTTYGSAMALARAMRVPLDKFVEWFEDQNPKVVSVLKQFSENYMRLHRYVKKVRNVLEEKTEVDTKAAEQAQFEILYQLHLLREMNIEFDPRIDESVNGSSGQNTTQQPSVPPAGLFGSNTQTTESRFSFRTSNQPPIPSFAYSTGFRTPTADQPPIPNFKQG